MLLGAVAVSALRLEGLVESGCVVEKKNFCLCLLKLATGGNKEHNTGFLAVETHRLCPVGHNVTKNLSVEQIFL